MAEVSGAKRTLEADRYDVLVGKDFGHWLAGFVDGEGCFTIVKHHNRSFQCSFVIRLRFDDIEVLRMIQATLGIGIVYDRQKHNSRSKPSCSFVVRTRDQCEVLCRLFTQFPLRAKKSKSFAVWRRAVIRWRDVGWASSATTNARVWADIQGCQQELARLRKCGRR
jgi:hypothetical protein